LGDAAVPVGRSSSLAKSKGTMSRRPAREVMAATRWRSPNRQEDANRKKARPRKTGNPLAVLARMEGLQKRTRRPADAATGTGPQATVATRRRSAEAGAKPAAPQEGWAETQPPLQELAGMVATPASPRRVMQPNRVRHEQELVGRAETRPRSAAQGARGSRAGRAETLSRKAAAAEAGTGRASKATTRFFGTPRPKSLPRRGWEEPWATHPPPAGRAEREFRVPEAPADPEPPPWLAEMAATFAVSPTTQRPMNAGLALPSESCWASPYW
jgi:hypothetical protein